MKIVSLLLTVKYVDRLVAKRLQNSQMAILLEAHCIAFHRWFEWWMAQLLVPCHWLKVHISFEQPMVASGMILLEYGDHHHNCLPIPFSFCILLPGYFSSVSLTLAVAQKFTERVVVIALQLVKSILKWGDQFICLSCCYQK